MNAPQRFLTWRHEENFDESSSAVTEAQAQDLRHLSNPVASPYTPAQDRVPRKLLFLKDSKRPNAGTFILSKEDHTIGNLMRLQLLRNRQVRFAGYRMPHPLIFDCHIRVETMDATSTPKDAFESSLQELNLELDLLNRSFDESVEKYNETAFLN
jgi:DNA-directed RNA polymerase II subunit RPB11